MREEPGVMPVRAEWTDKIEPKRAPRNTLPDERGAARDRSRSAGGWSPRRGYWVTIVPIFTTSKSRALTLLSAANSSSLQRGSGAPLTYQALPLSASSIP